MSNKNFIAILFAIAMGVWLFSGELVSTVLHADDSAVDIDIAASAKKTTLVRAIKSHSTIHQQILEVSGQTRANRIVNVKAEVSGRIEQVVSEKGTRVKAGDVLCRIAIDTRLSEFEKAKANLQSAQIEYDGILNLRRKSLQSEVNVAKAKATLASSKAAAKAAELALKKTNIVAPFAGVVDLQPVELGDFLNVGQTCVTLLEIDPILVVGQVSERRINQVQMGGEVKVELIGGEQLVGKVSFIGRAPDATTRTYPVEVTILSPGPNIRTGLSAQMKVPQGNRAAHLISSASLVLNDSGEIGVHIIDDKNRVHFTSVSLLSEEASGTWVGGLPDVVSIITVGQDDVIEGQLVRVDYAPLGSVVGF